MRLASRMSPLRTGLCVLAGVGAVVVLALPAAGGGAPNPPSVPTLPGGPTTTDDPTVTTEDQTTTTEGGSRGTGEPASTDRDGDAGTSDSEDGGLAAPASASDGGDGVSGVLVALLVLGAFVLGLLVAAVPLFLLGRRRAGGSGQGGALSPAAPSPPGVSSSAGATASAGPNASAGSVAPAGPAETPATVSNSASATTGAPVIGAAPSREEALIQNQRTGLAAALINLRDQMPSDALAEEAQRALAAAGITEVRPDGETFDPARHRAASQVDTNDALAHDRIVATERVGYVDGSRPIRLPEVVVARHGEAP